MGIIRLETKIEAPIERCFDLSLSVDLHLASATGTSEKAVAGVTSGIMKLGDTVTWEARHFGIPWRLTSKITDHRRPSRFADVQVSGPFSSFIHTHEFRLVDGGTIVVDTFEFECPFGIFGRMADPFVTRHLEEFLRERNRVIKLVAEDEDWQRYVKTGAADQGAGSK